MATGTPATVALTTQGIVFTVHEYHHDPATPSFGLEAAAALGVEPDRVFKTLLAEVDGVGLVVGIVPVTGSLDLKGLAAATGGKRAAMAPPALAERRTGYVVGGISPTRHQTALTPGTHDTAQLPATAFVSGARRAPDLELDPSDLLDITGATFADISRA